MQIGVFINARVGSKRLPNKHLKVIKNEPLLSILLTRLISRLEEYSYGIDLTILLTTGKQEENQILAQIASKVGLNTFFGSENNIPFRHLQALKFYDFDAVVSIDADDIIPSIEALHETVAALVSGQPLVKTRNLPIGMNVHGYTGATLENALKGIELEQFETGWMQIFESFDIYNIAYADFDKFNVIRATIDYEDDFKFFERVLNEISNWNALSTFALCEEVISRKIYLENTYLNDEYWEYHNKNKQQEKLIR